MVGSAIPSLELAEDTIKHTFSPAFVFHLPSLGQLNIVRA